MASLHHTIAQERPNSSALACIEDAVIVRDTGPPRASQRNSPGMRDRLAELAMIQEQVDQGPSARSTEQQHARGKLTVRERLELLLDDGSFVEIEALRRHRATGFGLENRRPHTDGVVTGWGTDRRAHRVRLRPRLPDLRWLAGRGARREDPQGHGPGRGRGRPADQPQRRCRGADPGGRHRRWPATAASSAATSAASGVIPQISVMLGPCAGGAAYSPALTDFVFMVRGTSQMFITGPDVVQAVTGESVSHEELGGASVHATPVRGGHLRLRRRGELPGGRPLLVSLLPVEQPGAAPAGRRRPTRPTGPRGAARPRARRPHAGLRHARGDRGDRRRRRVLRVPRGAGRANIVCALARIDGHVVGIVANQPLSLAGVLDINASEKAARFVQTCDAFNIPLVTLVDVPGFLPGTDQEHGGIIRHGAKLLYAYCDGDRARASR